MNKILVFIFCLTAFFGQSQERPVRIIINAGAPVSFNNMAVTAAIKTGLNQVGLKGTLETSFYQSYHIDGLIQNKFLLGFGYNGKSWSYEDRYEKYLETGDTVISQGTVNLDRTSLTVRAGYAFVSNEKHFAYGGLRIGTSLWRVNFDGDLKVNDGEQLGKSLSNINIPVTLPTGHLFFGYHYYFIENLGVHVELGAGFGPYTVQGGLSIRI